MNLNEFPLKIAKAIAWIAGSIAGLTGLLYAAGFLVNQAHLNMLGVSSLVKSSNVEYLMAGGEFFLSLIPYLLSVTILWYWWLFGLIVLITILIKSQRRLKYLKRWVKKLRLNRIITKPGIRLTTLLLICVIFLIILYQYTPTLGVSDLLFNQNSEEIHLRSSGQGIKSLRLRFGQLELLVIISFICLWVVNRLRREQEGLLRLYRWFLYLIFLTQLILLPINYGVLAKSNTYHTISLLSLEDGRRLESSSDKQFWLLKKDTDGLIVYSSKDKKIMVIKMEEVMNLTAGKKSNIFERKEK